MQVKKTVKIPVHYATTRFKQSILDNTTARITYCIKCINELMDSGKVLTDTDYLTYKNIRKIVKDNHVAEKTKLSSGFVDQCVEKIIFTLKSYKKLHKEWERKIKSVEEQIAKKEEQVKKGYREEEIKKLQKKLERRKIYFEKVKKREPTPPIFENKTPCRIDCRTGKIQWSNNSKLTSLWMHLSTLKKNDAMDVPLNPSKYHMRQLKGGEIQSFEIIKTDGKYYVHICIKKEIQDKKISSVGGIDQGLNHSAGVVLLSIDGCSLPYEELVCDKRKQELLRKYDDIVSELRHGKKYRRLQDIRNKRYNISVEYDWQIANRIASVSKGAFLGIGDANFRQTQYRGNGMPTLRKRIGKWPYSRQRSFITLRRAENGDQTILISEKGSNDCHRCGSHLVSRRWLPSGESYIICYSCGLKKDADLNAPHNIAYKTALRCQDERLKAGMNLVENWRSLQYGCPSIH